MKIKILSGSLLLVALIFFFCIKSKKEIIILSAPAGNRYAEIDKNGSTVIPNGRLLTPSGKSIMVAPHPYGLTLSRDGNIAVTANSGTSPLSITIIRDILSDTPRVQQIPPGPVTDKGVLASVLPFPRIINKYLYPAARKIKSLFSILPQGEKPVLSTALLRLKMTDIYTAILAT